MRGPGARKSLIFPVSGADPVHDAVHAPVPPERLLITMRYHSDLDRSGLTWLIVGADRDAQTGC
jgi:hypothetical protein